MIGLNYPVSLTVVVHDVVLQIDIIVGEVELRVPAVTQVQR